MRPLFDQGVRPATFANLLLELHSKEYTKKYICYESKLKERKISQKNKADMMFGSFGGAYGGKCPTGHYLKDVYCSYMQTISDHLDKQVSSPSITPFNGHMAMLTLYCSCRSNCARQAPWPLMPRTSQPKSWPKLMGSPFSMPLSPA